MAGPYPSTDAAYLAVTRGEISVAEFRALYPDVGKAKPGAAPAATGAKAPNIAKDLGAAVRAEAKTTVHGETGDPRVAATDRVLAAFPARATDPKTVGKWEALKRGFSPLTAGQVTAKATSEPGPLANFIRAKAPLLALAAPKLPAAADAAVSNIRGEGAVAYPARILGAGATVASEAVGRVLEQSPASLAGSVVGQALPKPARAAAVKAVEAVAPDALAKPITTREHRGRTRTTPEGEPSFLVDFGQALERGDSYTDLARAVAKTQQVPKGSTLDRVMRRHGMAADLLLDPLNFVSPAKAAGAASGALKMAKIAPEGVGAAKLGGAYLAGRLSAEWVPEAMRTADVVDVGQVVESHVDDIFRATPDGAVPNLRLDRDQQQAAEFLFDRIVGPKGEARSPTYDELIKAAGDADPGVRNAARANLRQGIRESYVQTARRSLGDDLLMRVGEVEVTRLEARGIRGSVASDLDRVKFDAAAVLKGETAPQLAPLFRQYLNEDVPAATAPDVKRLVDAMIASKASKSAHAREGVQSRRPLAEFMETAVVEEVRNVDPTRAQSIRASLTYFDPWRARLARMSPVAESEISAALRDLEETAGQVVAEVNRTQSDQRAAGWWDRSVKQRSGAGILHALLAKVPHFPVPSPGADDMVRQLEAFKARQRAGEAVSLDDLDAMGMLTYGPDKASAAVVKQRARLAKAEAAVPRFEADAALTRAQRLAKMERDAPDVVAASSRQIGRPNMRTRAEWANESAHRADQLRQDISTGRLSAIEVNEARAQISKLEGRRADDLAKIEDQMIGAGKQAVKAKGAAVAAVGKRLTELQRLEREAPVLDALHRMDVVLAGEHARRRGLAQKVTDAFTGDSAVVTDTETLDAIYEAFVKLGERGSDAELMNILKTRPGPGGKTVGVASTYLGAGAGVLRLLTKFRIESKVADLVDRLIALDMGKPPTAEVRKQIQNILQGAGGSMARFRDGRLVIEGPSTHASIEAARYVTKFGFMSPQGALDNVESVRDVTAVVPKWFKDTLDVSVRNGEVAADLVHGTNKGGGATGRVYDWIHDMDRLSVTVFHPAYHVGNLVSAPFTMALTLGEAAVAGAAGAWIKNRALVFELVKRSSGILNTVPVKAAAGVVDDFGVPHTAEALDAAIKKYGAASSRAKTDFATQMTADIAKYEPDAPRLMDMVYGPAAFVRGDSSMGELLSGAKRGAANIATSGKLRTMKSITNGLADFTQTMDQAGRLAVFVEAVKRGKSYPEAARLARESLYDYGRLSPGERTLTRRLFLFYAWQRLNVAAVTEALLKHPDRVVRQMKFLRAQEDAWGLDQQTQGAAGSTMDSAERNRGRLFLGKTPGPAPGEEGTTVARMRGTQTLPVPEGIAVQLAWLNFIMSAATLGNVAHTSQVEPWRESMRKGLMMNRLAPLPAAAVAWGFGVDPGTGADANADFLNRVPEGVVSLLDQMGPVGGGLSRLLGIHDDGLDKKGNPKWVAHNPVLWRMVSDAIGRHFTTVPEIAHAVVPRPGRTRAEEVQNLLGSEWSIPTEEEAARRRAEQTSREIKERF